MARIVALFQELLLGNESMKIELNSIKVRDIYEGFSDDGDEGVFAYGGKLTIRPPYQREFVYDLDKQEAVIQTILKKFPLNTMYWCKTGKDQYEILDGQQRTLSVMYYLKHKLQIKLDGKSYYEDSLPDDLYKILMDYEFMIYICEGSDSEKLSWFEVVNVGGEELTPQELRNSVYTGSWLSDAKRYFSKRNCAAKGLSDKYITGDPNRQELLEKGLKGIIEFQKLKDVTDYMAMHKSDKDADELWQYFQDVISWTQKIFPKYYPDMKGLDWCSLYNKYHSYSYNSSEMTAEVKRLHDDSEVQKKKGIYEYLLCRHDDKFAERHLNLRAFSDDQILEAYSIQKGKCKICGKDCRKEEMEADHIIPWSEGGRTIQDNLQMLCKHCNRHKSNK